MKCPKCGYLGYEHVDRCRNCGYDFVLSAAPPPPDLRLRGGDQNPAPIEDLALVDAAARPASEPRLSEPVVDPKLDSAPRAGLAELPLFGPPITDDVPLITRPSPPRTPLAVRRATPEVPRLRAEPRAPLLEWPADPGSPPTPAALRPAPRPEPSPAAQRVGRDVPAPASLVSRAAASVIDLLLLAIVDVIVVYFTLHICRLDVSEWRLLPKAPLLAFLIVQNGGYLIAFTAVGQTLGKMTARIRVVADDDDRSPDLGRAVLRTLLWLPLAAPAGLGLLSATMNDDKRAWHDRFAGTRVVSTRA
jgi:uncharacterized RDD family membrane protein YckC